MNGAAPLLSTALPAGYVLGVAIGLLTIDARPAARVGLATLWPLGPLAFLLTVTMLIVVAAIALPVRSLLRR